MTLLSADLRSNFTVIMLCKLSVQINPPLATAFSFLICCLPFPLAAAQAQFSSAVLATSSPSMPTLLPPHILRAPRPCLPQEPTEAPELHFFSCSSITSVLYRQSTVGSSNKTSQHPFLHSILPTWWKCLCFVGRTSLRAQMLRAVLQAEKSDEQI